MKQGKAAFAIRELILTSDPEEEEVLQSRDFNMIINFSTLGLTHLTLWYTSRKLEDEDVIFKFSRLTANYWCDERLLRAVKGFNLSEPDVMKLRGVFEDMQYGRNRETIRVDDMLRFVVSPCNIYYFISGLVTLFFLQGYPYNTIVKWAVIAIKPEKRSELKFSEYVHFLCYFIMLSARDLTRFLFRHADDEEKYYLR